MFFEFFKPDSKADSNRQNELNAEPTAVENDSPVKASSAENKIAEKKSAVEKKSAIEKESSVANTKEVETRKDRLKRQSNSKVECRNPDCKEPTLCAYDGELDEEGEPMVSFMYCLNCGFNFPYFDKFEKEVKKPETDLNWGAGFSFLVLMLFAVIVIKGDQNGLFSQDAPSPNLQRESVRSLQTDPFPQGEYRILNDAEPFNVNDNS